MGKYLITLTIWNWKLYTTSKQLPTQRLVKLVLIAMIEASDANNYYAEH